MLGKIYLLLNTVKHLKPTQVFHQVKYRLNKAGILSDYEDKFSKGIICRLSFSMQPPVYKSYLGDNKFTFLNLNHSFPQGIDWNHQEYGKLWNYNLQYLNFLLQPDFALEEKQVLINSIYEWLADGRLALEPYPASLRIINIIRLYSLGNDLEEGRLAHLHAELDFLSNRLEYHLLGNHLLENGFALLLGGAFFSNKEWLKTGENILREQLEEQILTDGGHFELSPMYHQIIVFRLLELIDWYSKYAQKKYSFEQFLISKAEKMLSWLENISFSNGDIPHFNDSAEGIAYPTSWLTSYATEFGIKSNSNGPLGASGYRSISKGPYECKLDIGQVGPSYQPGHAHADALSFDLYYNNTPLIVEQGTSTYNIGEIRSKERSTAAHNTVVVNGRDQSQVWSGFRVGKRAKVEIIEETPNQFAAQHNGYANLGIIHKRVLSFEEKEISINDEAEGKSEYKKEFHLHFAPGIGLEKDKKSVRIKGIGEIKFDGAEEIAISRFQMADGYNRYKDGEKIIVRFKNRLSTNITFKK